MKRIGLYIIEVGMTGVLIGGCILDGPDYLMGLALMFIFSLVTAAGGRLYKAGETREQEKMEAQRRVERFREDTFRRWMANGIIGGR